MREISTIPFAGVPFYPNTSTNQLNKFNLIYNAEHVTFWNFFNTKLINRIYFASAEWFIFIKLRSFAIFETESQLNRMKIRNM